MERSIKRWKDIVCHVSKWFEMKLEVKTEEKKSREHENTYILLKQWFENHSIKLFTSDFIAICAKIWNCVNLSIFASSEAETCSTSIAMTRRSIFIILVVSESPRWYLLHNVYYKPRGLIIKFICERTSFETVQDLGPYFGWNLYI